MGDPKRLALSVGIGVASLLAATASGMHATANALAKRAPELASTLSDTSPLPLERLARAKFVVAENATSLGEVDVSSAREPARAALDRSLLSPMPLAVLAWDAPADRRARLMEMASSLGKRDPFVQAALLRQYDMTGEPRRALAVFDEMLRVRPNLASSIMPKIVSALEDDSLVMPLADVLASGPVWRDQFLESAAGVPSVAENLVRLRLALPDTAKIPVETDREIIGKMLKAGSFSEAITLYRRFDPRAGSSAEGGELDWSTQYPPFDWLLSDGYEAYARPQQGGGLRIRILPGSGGPLATRLIDLPGDVRGLRIVHDFDSDEAREGMQIALTCAGQTEPLAERTFASSPFVFEIPPRPSDCTVQLLTISGRSWTTGAPIEGKITGIGLVR